MNNLSISQAIEQAITRIDRLDAQLLLSHVLEKPRAYLIAWPDRSLSQGQWIIFNQLVTQRSEGYPVAYITGTKSFWDMDLIVTPDVLIPRPDTELLVEIALTKLPKNMNSSVLELATGSGAIACALARERPDLSIIATDISIPALTIAERNAQQYDLQSIQFIQSDWFLSIEKQSFDLILTNPPYLSNTDPHLSTDIRFEPRDALVSGVNGDEDYVHIISQADQFLKQEGWIMFEHGAEQGKRLRELLTAKGYQQVETFQDLAELDRVTVGQYCSLI